MDPNRPLTPEERAQYQAIVMGQPMPQAAPPRPADSLDQIRARATLASMAASRPSVNDDPGRPITAEEAARYGASPREAQIAASNKPTPAYETWEQRQARTATLGPTPDAKPMPIGPSSTPAPTAKPINEYGPGAAIAGGPSAPTDINWNRGASGAATIPAHEVAVVAKERQTALTGAIDAEAKAIEAQKDAAKGSATAQAEVKRQEAIGARDMAKATEDAGVDVRLRGQAARDESKAYLKHIDDFSEKLAKDQINPNRMYENATTGQRITWTIASMFGAVAQGLLHQSSNQVADKIEAMAAADVAAQKAQHEIGRGRLADMHSLYGHAMQATNDAENAERIATGYALESAKHEAQALAMTAQSDVQKAKGQELVEALGERQALIGQKKTETEIKMNPLVQARTVATGPDMREVYKTARAYTEEQAKLGTIVPPDAAIQWAYKMHTGANPLPGQSFVQGAKLEGANKELKETQTATDEFNKQIANLRNHPVITGSGLGTEIGAHLPQRVAPESNDAQQQLHAINTQMLQAIGKVAKDADGKPNKAMIEKIEKRFEIHLGDKPEIKQQKLQGVADVYNALARQQGAKAPEPAAAPVGSFKP